ncbi:transposase [Clostridium sp. Marseille-P2415]|uniref:transposase n=1 Tax=Clostridium sp. Marseille-P2415 TaxID=1805471 RepID=UPI001F23F33C|nr:transposase [Clostridium sp. Marseille-P2415]
MGNELTLMTNLSKQYSGKQLQDLYYQRWEIEKKYHTLKNKMKFENVTGKAIVYVYQDFCAQILVYNMIQDVRNAANANLRKNHKGKIYKYSMKTNENIAIGLFKEEMIKILLKINPLKRKKRLTELQTEI